MVPRHGADPVPVGFCCSQGAFPARLKKVFIVGAPMWFRLPYSIISLLLKEKLRERVSVSRGVTALPLPALGVPCPVCARFPPVLPPEASPRVFRGCSRRGWGCVAAGPVLLGAIRGHPGSCSPLLPPDPISYPCSPPKITCSSGLGGDAAGSRWRQNC